MVSVEKYIVSVFSREGKALSLLYTYNSEHNAVLGPKCYFTFV